MTLAAELEAFRNSFMTKVPPEIRAAMERADSALLASQITDRATKIGDTAPDFELPGADGQPVSMKSLLQKGPVVISFYRGGWCPYCNLELRALQAVLPQIAGLGATLVAVSPQTHGQSLTTAERNELAFPVLSDHGSRVAHAFGVAFDLAEELRPIYTQFNHALPVVNGSEEWTLPIPATYVIGQDGVIAFSFVDTDYRKRLEPSTVLETLCGLTGSPT